MHIFFIHFLTTLVYYVGYVFCLVSWKYLPGNVWFRKSTINYSWRLISATYVLGCSFIYHSRLCTCFPFLIIKQFEFGLEISKYNYNKKNIYKNASYSYNNINQYGKISPVDSDEIQLFWTNPALNKFSPIERENIFLQADQ